MTKVIAIGRAFCTAGVVLLLLGGVVSAQAKAAASTPPKSAEDLFLQLGNTGLDPARIFHIRDAEIDRAAFHITLDDGVIGFTSDVAGKITGAFFEGEGEILLTPPNQVERASMMLQTGATILEERFLTADFRFNDETFADLRPFLSPPDNAADFVSRWDEAVRTLSRADALRLFVSFAKFLPPANARRGASPDPSNDRFLHARLQGRTKGAFDVYFDSNAPEQVWAAQLRDLENNSYYDVWTSFSFLPRNKSAETANAIASQEGRANTVDILSCKVRADIRPPTTIRADAELDLQIRQGGQRAILFELARALVIKRVEADGQPVEFIHNPAIEGSQLARRGNDLVAVVFPQPTYTGQNIKLRFIYGGDVLSEAGAGLLYVGARGIWYPNRGLAMTNFDLEFHYPPEWTLVATGKAVAQPQPDAPSSSLAIEPAEQVSRWVSERPIPFAGFNLGKYRRATVHVGDVVVDAYGTGGVERGFPEAENRAMVTVPSPPGVAPPPAVIIHPAPPSPARNTEMVANAAAQALEFYSRRFGPYPLSELALTQMPGPMSQGWPGLVFLSSYSFLTSDEISALHMDPVEKILTSSIVAHETAHQWWGDLVTWNDYRDQWISEGLANYSALMLLESQNPRAFHEVLTRYRDDLLQKNKSDVALMEDGPVTLGARLSCSQFPEGYVAISYGRGTWLFHMLRTMMRDGERRDSDPDNEPFIRALRRMRDKYQGKSITSRDMLQVFQEDLPPALRYEGRKSLDWFYDGWVNGTAIPRFELRNVKYADKEGATTVSGLILQKDAPQDLVTPVPLYASHGSKQTFAARVFADGPETPFHITAPAGTRRIIIDPNQTLLARTH